MGEPALSVVVASVNGMPYIADCLDALEARCPEAEVVVADGTDASTRGEIGARWPAVRLLSFEQPGTVPELRAEGIAAARAPYVAVIEDHCVVTDGWSGRIVAAHEGGHAVVGGGVRNGAVDRVRDWAAFLCEYSEHMDPVPKGTVRSLVGMNVSYDRRALDAIAGLLREGRWESWLHPHLQRCGFELHSDPAIVLDHVKDFGVREFLSQRYHYARSHAGMRGAELGPRRAVYVAGSPLIVPLIYSRIWRNVFSRGRCRLKLLKATPLILLYLAAWALGEAVGYAIGGGSSLRKVK